MSEDQDLMARIGHLAGKLILVRRGGAKSHQGHINLHKTQNIRSSTTSILKNRSAGFSVPRNRLFERARKPIFYTHKNRSLVFKKEIHSAPDLDTYLGLSVSSAEMPPSNHNNSSSSPNEPIKWVAKRDRHMQLINSNVYNNNVSDRSPVTPPTTTQIKDDDDRMVEQSLQGGYSSANHASLSASTNAIQQVPKSGISGAKPETSTNEAHKFRMSRSDRRLWDVRSFTYVT